MATKILSNFHLQVIEFVEWYVHKLWVGKFVDFYYMPGDLGLSYHFKKYKNCYIQLFKILQ